MSMIGHIFFWGSNGSQGTWPGVQGADAITEAIYLPGGNDLADLQWVAA